MRNPGKFENEPEYTESFYESWLNGVADESLWDTDDTYYSVFKLTPEDKAVHTELSAESDYLILREDSQGFVYTRELTSAEYAKFESEINAAWESMSENSEL